MGQFSTSRWQRHCGQYHASFTARNVASGKTVLDLAGIIDFYPGSAGGGIDGFLIQNGDGKDDFLPVMARYAGAVRAYQTMVSIRNCEIRTSNTYNQLTWVNENANNRPGSFARFVPRRR